MRQGITPRCNLVTLLQNRYTIIDYMFASLQNAQAWLGAWTRGLERDSVVQGVGSVVQSVSGVVQGVSGVAQSVESVVGSVKSRT